MIVLMALHVDRFIRMPGMRIIVADGDRRYAEWMLGNDDPDEIERRVHDAARLPGATLESIVAAIPGGVIKQGRHDAAEHLQREP
ncbi:hypothetical protein [Sandaracinus amylolyticus]|uniref:hypothetical protein n=1 Tax=Sandaracinus amylolyticus TaxID=927083 RepID=UPI001F47F076|nr:hypothetical protein [Sandaracinus amylolyticus]UJR87073.1 Hypothetical protein I5071_91740 [Sandaracinus amylolyticus]